MADFTSYQHTYWAESARRWRNLALFALLYLIFLFLLLIPYRHDWLMLLFIGAAISATSCVLRDCHKRHDNAIRQSRNGGRI